MFCWPVNQEFLVSLSHPRQHESDVINIPRADLLQLQDMVRGYRSTIENAIEGIIQTTAEGKFLNVNPAFAKMLGYSSPQELLSLVTNINSQIYVEQDVRADFLNRINADGQARCEYQAWKKDGSTTWLLASARTVFNDSGQFLYYESIVEDVSERRQKEAKLEKLTESLSRSNEELKRFAKVVAHDLCHPLSTVQSYCELLSESIQEKLTPSDRESFDVIAGSVKRMRDMVYDVLEVAQIDANPLVEEDVDLNVVIDEVVQDLADAIHAANASVRCDSLPKGQGDRLKLRRLFQNLLSNALKFRRDVPLKISISAQFDDFEWTFCVKDNGIGFDNKHRERVFEMFSRLTSPRQHPGSGMGLALCKSIVQIHGGRIWVHSTPGVGTTFYFTLPSFAPRASSSGIN